MYERLRRPRSQAIYDKSKTTSNYDRLDNNNPAKIQFQKMRESYVETLKHGKLNLVKGRSSLSEGFDLNLPAVPESISDPKKVIEPPIFHESAFISQNFDEVQFFENPLSLINFQEYIGQFKDDEFKNLTMKDIYGFDPADYDAHEKKNRELKQLFKGAINDKDLYEYYKLKQNESEEMKERFKIINSHVDKIENIMLFDDYIKFFFKKDLVMNLK